jgi:O-antigen/teichoic acid export membrane protein
MCRGCEVLGVTEVPNNGDHRETHRRSGAIQGALILLGSSYCDMLFGIVRGILVMNYLGPTGRGVMRLVAMAHKYLTNAHLGILHGVSKELPQALGRGDTKTADEVENVGGTYVTLSGLVGALVMLVFSQMGDYGPETRLAIILGGGLIITQQVYALYRVVIRSWGHFPTLAGGTLVNTTTEFALIIVGAYYFHTLGAMVGWLVADVLTVLYYRFFSRFNVDLSFNWRVAFRLIKTGLPISLIIFADTLLRTVDGIIVVGNYSAYRFGLYSVAMQMATYLYSIPETGGFVITPRIIESYAANGDLARVRRQIILPTFAAATIMPVAAGCAFVMLPPMVRIIVPKFEGCIFAAQVLSLGSVLLALPVAANGLLVARNQEWWVIFSKGFGAGVIYLYARWLATHGASLRHIALATTAGYFIASIMSLTKIMAAYCESRFRLFMEIALCYAPLAWSIGALRLSGALTASAHDPLGSDWHRALIRLVLFLVMMAPVMWYGNQRTGLFHEFRQIGARFLDKGRNNGGQRSAASPTPEPAADAETKDTSSNDEPSPTGEDKDV